MKTKSIILVVLTIVFCSFQTTFAQNTFEKQDTTLTLDSTKIIYTCPMHSEIISDKPGTCPRCGMELVKMEKEKEKKQSESMQHQMGMMMGPMHGMADMDQNNNQQKKDNMKMMTGMGIGMGILMVIMMVVILL